MPRSFALGASFEAFIDSEVESGRYDDPDEVVREGLRLLKQSSPRLDRTAELRLMVLEARADPSLVDGGRVFDRLEAKYRKAADENGR